MSRRARATGGRVMLLGGGTAGVASLALLNVPWGVVATLTVCAAAVSVVQLVFPQESRDRLDLWRDLFRHRERQRAAAHRNQPALEAESHLHDGTSG